LEHLPAGIYEKTIGELKRVSRRYLLISVPNQENLDDETMVCHNCGARMHRYGHLRNFTPAMLLSLFPGSAVSVWQIGSQEPYYPSLLTTIRGPKCHDLPCLSCGAKGAGGVGLRFKLADLMYWNLFRCFYSRPYWVGALYVTR
jgi:hypothetical protein